MTWFLIIGGTIILTAAAAGVYFIIEDEFDEWDGDE